MLEPRETNILALFLLFFVLPLVSYFLLGKWSETAKSKKGLTLVARGTTEEARLVGNITVGCVLPVVQLPNTVAHQCVRCFDSATTRCSQCKSVWYCSGRCQIAHWRQVHKLECQQLVKQCNRSSPKSISSERFCKRVSYAEKTEQSLSKSSERSSREDIFFPEDTRLEKGDFALTKHHANNPRGYIREDGDLKCTCHDSGMIDRGCPNAFHDKNKPERLLVKKSSKLRNNPYSNGTELNKSPKSRVKVPLSPYPNIKLQTANASSHVKDNNPFQESKKAENFDTMKAMSMKKMTKTELYQHLEDSSNGLKTVKMIFPYEEFVKCFQFEALNMKPRGLVNCGNSCYANAVLQCLTCTKPLIVYLLRRSHSRAGCAKDWCLMCELEQLIVLLRESRGPLSPLNILMYIRSLNSQIGDGSQEDAHEFLRLLVASMQSICLEGFGEEKHVDPRVQDTTFIQHMFRGRLRSKVKCSRCHHESERYENIMDLTLEIFGWVKSLEDALTQFTSSEDLDGENMYKCARCVAYVRAWKQLSIQEAPNILTLVLKRFQKGNYGKINKCITFPEMLDMVPFMAGTDDTPPLYMLYAVVVHLDKSNASFSGHYISYVKDLQGNWFMVDDTEVQPVEVEQVMSQGAYILFYIRSSPRPAKNFPSFDRKMDTNLGPSNASIQIFVRENKSRPTAPYKNLTDFTKPPSLSHGSHFTSSDDSSFTTESTRDSFGALDQTDIPFSSIFGSLHGSECVARPRFGQDESVNVNYGREVRRGQTQSSY